MYCNKERLLALGGHKRHKRSITTKHVSIFLENFQEAVISLNNYFISADATQLTAFIGIKKVIWETEGPMISHISLKQVFPQTEQRFCYVSYTIDSSSTEGVYKFASNRHVNILFFLYKMKLYATSENALHAFIMRVCLFSVDIWMEFGF